MNPTAGCIVLSLVLFIVLVALGRGLYVCGVILEGTLGTALDGRGREAPDGENAVWEDRD